MKTYWDYSDKEQSELTEDQVRSLLEVELMTQGVKNPTPPVLVEVPKSPLGDKQKLFTVVATGKYGSDTTLGVAFNTIGQAQAFVNLCPCVEDYDYEVGSEFAYYKPVVDAKITTKDLFSIDQINAFRSELKNRKAKTEANEKAQSAYNEAIQKTEKITKGVWSDWYAKLDMRQSMREIVETFKRYTKLSEGDEAIAMRFLGKAYTAEQIAQAYDWFPGEIRQPDSQVAPPPAKTVVEPAKEDVAF